MEFLLSMLPSLLRNPTFSGHASYPRECDVIYVAMEFV